MKPFLQLVAGLPVGAMKLTFLGALHSLQIALSRFREEKVKRSASGLSSLLGPARDAVVPALLRLQRFLLV